MNASNEPRHPQRSRTRLLLICGLIVATACLSLLLKPSNDPRQEPAPMSEGPVAEATSQASQVSAQIQHSPQPFMERLGITVNGVNLAVGGTRLDLRYVVLDPNRAVQLTNKAFSAYLLDSRGKPLLVPSTPVSTPIQNQSGQKPKPGYTYSHFFANPNHAVKTGDQVTLVIGGLRESLIVR